MHGGHNTRRLTPTYVRFEIVSTLVSYSHTAVSPKSKPPSLHLPDGAVERQQQRRHRLRAWEFVTVEEGARVQLADVEGLSCLALRAALQPPRGRSRHPQPHPCRGRVAEHRQRLVRIHECERLVLGPCQMCCNLLRTVHSAAQRAGALDEDGTRCRARDARLCLGRQHIAPHRLEQVPATAALQLAADKGLRVDARGALMDHIQALVAVELLQRVILHVARAAEDLHRELVALERPFGRPRLDNLSGHVEQRRRLRVARRRSVMQAGRVQTQRRGALGVSLLQEQHPLDVVVLDDRSAALLALLRVQERLEEPTLAERRRAQPDLDCTR
mmetsp:Transcript_14320/g.37996  ORF Transcript_14320/g.37996 Transcript_14320/m.37996 type:complete len:330 (-) Transcript_14320:94-1083(-)